MATDLTGLTARLDVSFTATAQKAVDLSTPQEQLSISKSIALTFSVAGGAGLCNMEWSDRRVLAASANEELDLVGVLAAPLSPVVSFKNIKFLIIKNTSDEVTTIHPTATIATMKIEGGTHPLAQQPVIPLLGPGGIFVLAAGTAAGNVGALAAGAQEDIKITNNDGSYQLQYEIVVIGESLT